MGPAQPPRPGAALLRAGRLVGGCAAILLVSALSAVAEEPRIDRLLVTEDARGVLLFARVPGALDAKAVEALHHGLPLSIEFRVELFRERRLWPDRLIGAFGLSHALRYDALKEEYAFTSEYAGRQTRKVTGELGEAAEWMATLSGAEVKPLSRLGGGRRYYVRLRASLSPARDFFERNVFFFQEGDGWRTPWLRSPLFASNRPMDR